MKAIVSTAYGPPEVLQLKEVNKPIPADNEVLIRIHATTVTAGDCEVRSFRIPLWLWLPVRLFMGIFKPRIRILGQELAGEVEMVGSQVTRFKPGDKVFAPTDMKMGAYAEYISLPESHALSKIPRTLTFDEAVTLPVGGVNAQHFLRKANIVAGNKILINGAGGSIGTYAVQIAKSLGAEVTVVDRAEKLEMLRSLGADHAIDFNKEDFTTLGNRYDVIFDVAGTSPYARSVRSLDQGGWYLHANPNLTLMVRSLWTSMTTNKRVYTGMADGQTEDLDQLARMAEAGTIRAVIDRKFRLEEMVEAHRYVEEGRKIGNVVVVVP